MNRPSTAPGPVEAFDEAVLDEGTAAFDGLPGRLCMFYQPDAALPAGTVGGAEALLRWWHPDFGMLRPDRTLRGTRWDDTSRIEAWAMASVCRQAATWAAIRPDLQVALNVTRRFLLADGFLGQLDEALAAGGADPRQLAIDVPVSAIGRDAAGVRSVADALAARGVGVVIDGVGVRTRLIDLEVIGASAWKVDLWPAERTRRTLHPAVTEALRRAQHAGVVPIAKAVEDDATLDLVREAGFPRAFGHAISPAITSASMTSLLRRSRTTPLLDPAG